MANRIFKIKQFRKELNTWRRMLAFLVQENVELKTTLAESVKAAPVANDLINAAEQYLCLFSRQDEIIKLARHDMAALDKLMMAGYEDDDKLKVIVYKQKQLHREMEKIEQQFNTLKFQFHEFLGKMI